MKGLRLGRGRSTSAPPGTTVNYIKAEPWIEKMQEEYPHKFNSQDYMVIGYYACLADSR